MSDCIRNDYRINSAGYANHRQVYEQANGPVPAGMVVMHSCGHRWCVNPEHLSVGTQSENRHEMVTRNVNPKQKLTQEEAELVLWCRRQGPRIGNYGWSKKVAETFDVNVSTIHRLITRHTFQEAG